MSSAQPRSSKTEASVSHLIIFNPDLKPQPRQPAAGDGERDKDHEDDIKEASQILFYTSREGGRVSRDTMLRQFGLAKGLMGFTDMVLGSEAGGKTGWWSVHSHKSRMIIWSPEEGFYFYLNVTLAFEKHGEALHTSQGLLDQMIFDGLRRGYEDFSLLYGRLPMLMPASPSTSAILDRFWTKFAFQFESLYLSPSDPGDLLHTWLGGCRHPSASVTPEILRGIGDLDVDSGLLGKEGPLHLPQVHFTEDHQALLRFLTHQLHLALPPRPAPAPPPSTTLHTERSTLGLGFGLGGRRKTPSTLSPEVVKEETRSTSWTAWVPGMGGSSSGAAPTKAVQPESGSGRWPALGFGGMSTVFGLGRGAQDDKPRVKDQSAQTSTANEVGKETAPVQSSEAGPRVDSAQAHHVEQSEVALPDLQEAVQPEDEIQLSWEKKDVWLPGGDGEYEKRRVAWIIRDETLLYLLYPSHTEPPYSLPSTSATLSVFASLTTREPRSSTESARTSTPSQTGDAWVYHHDGTTETSQTLDSTSSQTLAEMKDRLTNDTSLHEMYAKTSQGRFVVAKHAGEGELFLQVNRKDASLTDAEHAVRSLSRHHPDLTA